MTRTPGTVGAVKKLLLTLSIAALAAVAMAATAQARDLFVGGFFGKAAVVDTATNSLSGMPFAVGSRQFGVAITPDGTRAYFTDYFGGGKDMWWSTPRPGPWSKPSASAPNRRRSRLRRTEPGPTSPTAAPTASR